VEHTVYPFTEPAVTPSMMYFIEFRIATVMAMGTE
jgi:hypothetical protein